MLKIKPLRFYLKGKAITNDPHFQEGERLNILEKTKKPSRTKIINYLLSLADEPSAYLEIGVRNPNDKFNSIKASQKYGVDPGLEFKENPVEFKMTSDEFFEKLASKQILNPEIKFDVIFIDGLHTAPQVNKDINNSLKYLKDSGFIVLHDCNPPSPWHARENYQFINQPAGGNWNGTTWKAFLKWRFNPEVFSCCIDTDWGVGILSKTHKIGMSIEPINPFFEFNDFHENRQKDLNLISFESLKKTIEE